MKNRIFVERTKGVGVLSKEDAIAGGATGPVARASGVVRDLRRDEPYLAYDDFEFDVCAAQGGDCYARFQVRMMEIWKVSRSSSKPLRISLQVLFIQLAPERNDPDKREVYRSIEGLIHHFESIMPNRQMPAPRESIYAATESPNGELGYYIVGDGAFRAYRARTRPPSLVHFSLFSRMIRGCMLSDVVAVLGSINIIAAELDR